MGELGPVFFPKTAYQRRRTVKTCTKCGVEKPLGEFHANNSRRDGRQSACATCKNAYMAVRYAADPDRFLARQATYKRSTAFRSGPCTYLYRVGMEIIYVGRSDEVGRRLSNHALRRKPWVVEAYSVEVRRHGSLGDSLVHEARLIATFQPKYNVVGVSR